MRLIGLNGFKESGKDTTYACIRDLVQHHHAANDLNEAGRVERRAFADNLKIMAALSLGYEGTDQELIEAMNTLKESGTVASWLVAGKGYPVDVQIDGRTYLQHFGQHARNVFGDTFWVDQVVPSDGFAFQAVWETMGRKGARVGLPYIGVVTDVRYPNEAARIKELGGEIWEVVRPGRVSDGHSSEKPLPVELIDITIDNSGTVDDLEHNAWSALRNRNLIP